MATKKRFYDRTGLGRSLDPRHPNTWRVLIGSGLAFAIALIRADGFDFRPAVLAGGAVFLAWAIGRELDPDHVRSADLAMVVAFAFSLGGDVSLGAVGISLIALRLIAGTVGRRLYPPDVVVLFLAAAFGGGNPAAWPAVVVLIGVTALDSSLPRFIPIALATTAVGAAALFAELPSPGITAGAIGLIAAVAIAALAPIGLISSPTDSGRGAIDRRRVQAARITAAGIFIVATWLTADAWAGAPIAAALIGAALVWIWQRTATNVQPVAPVAPSSTPSLR